MQLRSASKNKEQTKNREPCCLAKGSDPIVKVNPRPTDDCDSFRIRSRLLNRLGIEKECAVAAARSEASSVVQLGALNAYNEVLKTDYGQPDKSLAQLFETQSCEESSLATSPGAESVLEKQASLPKQTRFDVNVLVHPIPSRSQYSERIRSALWSDPVEIQQNAARNSFEFAAEGWKWEQVAEDMVVTQDGERVHPIHFVQEHSLNKHFCDVFASQQKP